MKQLIQAEWYKIKRSKTLRYLCIAIFVVNSISAVSSVIVKKIFFTGQIGVLQIGSSMNAIWFGAFAGFFIASEFQNGSIRNVLALGKNRTHVFMAKVIAMVIAITIMLLVLAVSLTLCYTITSEFGTMSPGTYIPYFILNFFNELIFHLPYAGFFTLFAFLTKKAGLTILLSFGYEFLLLSIGAVLQNYSGKNLTFLLQYFPQYYYTKINEFLGNWQFITNGYWVSFGFTLIPVLIGIYHFKKSDIK
jgi:ABC-2 type transport system permease protein